DNYKENQITIVYDSMWNSTRKMAEAIAEGISSVDKEVAVKLLNSGKTDKNDILAEVFRSKAVLVGSSTINNGYLYSIGGILEMIKGLKMKGKTAAAFGSYGWSGEAVKQISEHLKTCGLNVVDEGYKTLWVPDASASQACVEYGKKLASLL
ncbi:MAG: flavodoxin domain-containing protein, partial [Eubacteriaceae bacterium]